MVIDLSHFGSSHFGSRAQVSRGPPIPACTSLRCMDEVQLQVGAVTIKAIRSTAEGLLLIPVQAVEAFGELHELPAPPSSPPSAPPDPDRARSETPSYTEVEEEDTPPPTDATPAAARGSCHRSVADNPWSWRHPDRARSTQNHQSTKEPPAKPKTTRSRTPRRAPPLTRPFCGCSLPFIDSFDDSSCSNASSPSAWQPLGA